MPRSSTPRRHRRAPRATGLVAAAVFTTAFGITAGPAAATEQPVLSTRSAPIITEKGLQFRDLDRNGSLTPYEDWRLTPEQRATDLVGRMTLAQRAGLMVHGTLPRANQNTVYDLAGTTDLIQNRSITTLLTRLSAAPGVLAEGHNAIQEIAEQQPLGIPALISTDPRNGFAVTAGQTVGRVGTTAMPDAIGMAAAGDPELTRELGDIVRQEYRAMGITEALSPQADIATEPRWDRIDGTFGSDPEIASQHVQAYVEGLQAGSDGLQPASVATVTKHWVGYGAQENGYDSHYYYGRYATFPGDNFADHLTPFEGAFAADTSGIMPTYSILEDLVYEGQAMDQVGAGFNSYLLQDVLRGEYGFEGVILSDWGITGDCPQACLDNRPPGGFTGPWGQGTPWGVEDLTILERFALAINAGVDQIGGTNFPSYVVEAVEADLITEDRVVEAAHRILVQKFELGLFENPYVDPAAATALAGNAQFTAVGDQAQADALTLLKNRGQLLPVRAEKAETVFLHGVAPEAATARGLTVTTDPAQADLAVIRMSDPANGPDLTGLSYTGTEADHQALQAAVDAGVRTVAVPKLDRPLILTNVVDRADAVLANFGVSDEVLFETLYGERAPGGQLPFELPSSMAAVEAQFEDVPDDSVDPLFEHGFGLSYVKGGHGKGDHGKGDQGKGDHGKEDQGKGDHGKGDRGKGDRGKPGR